MPILGPEFVRSDCSRVPGRQPSDAHEHRLGDQHGGEWLLSEECWSTVDELVALGWELNANQHRVVHLAARYDEECEWFRRGFKSASAAIAERLQIETSTAREWVRVGHMLGELPLIDAAFAANEISFAKVRIVTRWAEPDNEAELLALAESRPANRLRAAIAGFLAVDDDDECRDARHHEARSLTSYTDGDGMVVIRVVLAPLIAKVIIAAIEELVRRIARTPDEPTTPRESDATADAIGRRCVGDSGESATHRETDATAVAPGRCSATETPEPKTSRDDRAMTDASSLGVTLAELKRRWQPDSDDEWDIPTMAQQRADAFVAFFLGLDIDLTTEVVIHVRGDANTFDDGTPLTDNAVGRQLDHSFIRLLIHDAERRPVNASSRRRHPTVRQERVVLEAHNYECVDCAATDLLEFDHNPPYHQTKRTITDELEVRCAPCHRARHRTTTLGQLIEGCY